MKAKTSELKVLKYLLLVLIFHKQKRLFSCLMQQHISKMDFVTF